MRDRPRDQHPREIALKEPPGRDDDGGAGDQRGGDVPGVDVERRVGREAHARVVANALDGRLARRVREEAAVRPGEGFDAAAGGAGRERDVELRVGGVQYVGDAVRMSAAAT